MPDPNDRSANPTNDTSNGTGPSGAAPVAGLMPIDHEFAMLALDFGFVDRPTLDRLMADLAARRARGESLTMPAFLAGQEVMTPPSVRKILLAMNRATLVCPNPACGSRFDLHAFPASNAYFCRECKTQLHIAGIDDQMPPPPALISSDEVGYESTDTSTAVAPPSAETPAETTGTDAGQTARRTASGQLLTTLPDFISEQSSLLESDFDETTLEDTSRLKTLSADDKVHDDGGDADGDARHEPHEIPADAPYVPGGQQKGTSSVMVSPEDHARAKFDLATDDVVSGRGGLVHALRISRSVKAEYDLPLTDVPASLRVQDGESALHRTPAHLRFGFEGELKTSPEIIARGLEISVLSRDRDLRRMVRMRLLKQGSEATNDDIERFLEEVQIAAQLEHTAIPPVYELGIDDNNRLFAIERLVRTPNTLGTEFDARRRARQARSQQPPVNIPGPSTRHLFEILLKVADALAFAHANGVVYRNLFPSNIVVGDFGEVLVTDWSRAHVRGRPETRAERLIISERRPGGLAATIDGCPFPNPCYLSPEIAGGELERISARSDVYALGAIAYEIVAGEPPFSGADAWAVLTDVRTGRPKPLKKIRAARRTPAAVRAVIELALARQPEQRFADAGEFATALRRALESCGMIGRPEFLPRGVQPLRNFFSRFARLFSRA